MGDPHLLHPVYRIAIDVHIRRTYEEIKRNTRKKNEVENKHNEEEDGKKFGENRDGEMKTGTAKHDKETEKTKTKEKECWKKIFQNHKKEKEENWRKT